MEKVNVHSTEIKVIQNGFFYFIKTFKTISFRHKWSFLKYHFQNIVKKKNTMKTEY